MSTSAPEYMQRGWERAYQAEEAGYVAKAEEEASTHFNRAVAPQKAEYDATMRGLLGMVGPRWDRARDAAKAKWAEDTAAARALFDVTVQEILSEGEMSEATDAAWDALIKRPAQ